MARTSWFDNADLPIIHEQAQKLESFTQAMADGVIERKELEEQQASLVAAMKSLEPRLNDEDHEKVTRVMMELSAYNIMRLVHELQKERLERAFGNKS